MAEFKNPNQQGGQDNSSFLLLMFVALAVVFGFQWYRMKKNPPPAPPAAAQTQQQSQPQPGPAAAPAAPAASPAASASSAKKGAAAPAAAQTAAIQAQAETTTVVENELYRIVFSNRGAEVKSWVLKRNPTTGEVFTDDEGHPLDLVHAEAARQFGYPLSLNTADNNLNMQLKQALYVSSAQGTLRSPATLSFSYQDGGLKVVKTFTFDTTYVLHADVQVSYNGQPVRAALAWPAGFGDQENAGQFNTGAMVESLSLGKTNYVAAKKVSGNAVVNGPFDWAGVSDNYFAAIFMPDQPDGTQMTTFHNEADLAQVGQGAGKTSAKAGTKVPIVGAALAGNAGHTSTRLFVGPKAVDVLKNTKTADGHSLEPVLSWGFFGAIAKYLFILLKVFHTHVVSNWGWAIILMTVIINVLILPLRVQSMKSALKMQRIQPQVNAIKARYKNPKPTDPKAAEMNAEVMKLYKENNVNMFGGCLPSLIPLPLFYAFYEMLPNVVELRHAPWLWLRDLSQPDPHYVLPILTVVAMFFTSFLTPSPGVDPKQQRMMAFMMPVFFGVIVFNYGAALALYWVTGSLISIAAQLVMNQTSLGKEMREIAAKRARKAQGKTIQGKR